jgi:membrane protein YqaA with SNARE-associated domain
MLIIVLLLVALGITIGAGVNRVPLWPAVLIVIVALLVVYWPHAMPH